VVARALQLGKDLGELSSQLDPRLPAAEYRDVHLRWKTVYAELETVNATLRSRMTPRQRALLALGYAEMLRPLFARWAASTTRELYLRVMDALWASPGELTPSARALASQIDELPESRCDDSVRRDHVLGQALSFASQAVSVLATLDQDGREAEAGDFDEALQDFVNGLEECVGGRSFSPVPTELRATALQIPDDTDAAAATATMRLAASAGSKLVELALVPMAHAHGWPLERA
jgi:hypothetical protein